MPADGRESVLAAMKARLDTLTDAGSVKRLAFGTIPEGDLPRVIQFDGAEVRGDPAQDAGEGGTPCYVMSPYVVVVVASDDEDVLPTLLTAWVAAVKYAVGHDPATGLPESTLGELLQWATCVGVDEPTPVRAAEEGTPLVAQQVNFAFARPESELNPYLLVGF